MRIALANGMGLGDIEAFYNKSVHEIFSSKDTYWEQLQRGPGASAARRLQEIIKTDWPNRTPTSCPADSPACAFPFRHPPEADLPACCVVTTLVSRDPSRTCLLKSYQSNADASVPYLPAVHRATILQCIRKCRGRGPLRLLPFVADSFSSLPPPVYPRRRDERRALLS